MPYVIRFLVTMTILVPYLLIRQPREMVEIFVVTLVAFGSGRIAQALATPRSRPPDAKLP